MQTYTITLRVCDGWLKTLQEITDVSYLEEGEHLEWLEVAGD